MLTKSLLLLFLIPFGILWMSLGKYIGIRSTFRFPTLVFTAPATLLFLLASIPLILFLVDPLWRITGIRDDGIILFLEVCAMAIVLFALCEQWLRNRIRRAAPDVTFRKIPFLEELFE